VDLSDTKQRSSPHVMVWYGDVICETPGNVNRHEMKYYGISITCSQFLCIIYIKWIKLTRNGEICPSTNFMSKTTRRN